MKKLDFIGIGLHKAGTTWIADNLRKHPDVFIPEIKELEYFNENLSFYWTGPNPNYKKDLDWYHSFFNEADPNKLWGEFTVRYFEAKNAARDIYNYNPDVKIILSLRHPVEKVRSLFTYGKQKGVFKPDAKFEEIIENEDYVLENSMYAVNLKRYLDIFPREQILILFHKDLKADNRKFFKRVTDFLGLEEYYPEGMDERSNETGTVRSKFIGNFIAGGRKFIFKYNLLKIVPVLRFLGIIQFFRYVQNKLNFKKERVDFKIPEDKRQELLDMYKEDVERVESLTGRDLSEWKS